MLLARVNSTSLTMANANAPPSSPAELPVTEELLTVRRLTKVLLCTAPPVVTAWLSRR
jgi:hypothetical protein